MAPGQPTLFLESTGAVSDQPRSDDPRDAAVYRVDRASLLAALGGLGVPMDDAAFRK